jgi:phosphatidylglycerophosphatase C
MTTPQRQLVLFDFDGTLTKGDTLLHFLFFSNEPIKLIFNSLRTFFAWVLLFFKGRWAFENAKKALLKQFFYGQPASKLFETGAAFCQHKLNKLLRPEMIDLLERYKAEGATIVVVSASCDIWLRAFCEMVRVDLICTELAFEDGIFVGNWATPNCNGAEKVRRIKTRFQLDTYEKIIAYGNSSGDDAMLALADEAIRL